MKQFSKTFNSEIYGQVVIIQQSSNKANSGDEVTFFFKPQQLGVCNASMHFSDTDEGYALADKYFNNLTLEETEKFLKPIFDRLS